MAPVTVTYVNDADRSTWAGTRAGELLWFDFIARDGRVLRFWALPYQSVLILHRPWTIVYVEWVVHLAECTLIGGDPEQWTITDREIDILVEPDLQTYRVIDLEDFGRAIATGGISAAEAARVLAATQGFLDRHLHGGGHFPPPAVAAALREYHTSAP